MGPLDSDTRKDEILNSAQSLFVRHGFRKTTVEDIARACGLGKTALYYYFKGKEDIFQQVVRRESSRFVTGIEAAVAAQTDPTERVRAFIITRFAHIEEFLLLHRVSLQAARELAPLAEQARQQFFRREIELLTDLLEEGREQGVFRVERPDVMATTMISACVGIERQFVEVEGAPSGAEGLKELLDVLFDGLCR